MKKATLPLYAILVIAWLVCLQTDDNINIFNLSAYVSGNELSKTGENSSTVIVIPEIFSCYNSGNPACSLTKALQNDCCKLAVVDIQ